MPPEAFDSSLGAYYRLQHQLGAGAFGEVWQAVDQRNGQLVAAKLLHSRHFDDPELVGRFVFERSVLMKLRHPSVVSVRDMVIDGDRIAIVMELVANGSLRGVLRGTPTLPPQLAVDVAAAVLDGLAVAHSLGIVHRDIKPDNVLLGPQWWDMRPGDVKLVDFGIARIVAEGQSGSTAGMGTPNYMAPEVISRGEAGSAADVYAAGIMLYELLAGRTPFGDPGLMAIAIARRQVDLQPPRLDVPEPLELAMLALLDKDPKRRPTATEAAEALRQVRRGLGDLPALAPQHAPSPDDFESARPATMVRGLFSGPEPGAETTDDPHHTVVASSRSLPEPLARPTMPDPSPTPVPDPAPSSGQSPGRSSGPISSAADPAPLETTPAGAPARREPTDRRAPGAGRRTPALAAAAVALVLAAGGLYAVTRGGEQAPDPQPQGSESSTFTPGVGTFKSQLIDRPLPTGLSVSRTASYDAATGLTTLTLVYSAQAVPLTGPFLEVIPGVAAGECPPVTWVGAQQTPDLPTTSGMNVQCGGFQVDVGTVDAQSESTAVTAQFPLDLGDDPGPALDTWLANAAATTAAAIGDEDVVGVDSYPVQRIIGIQVDVPDSTLAGKPLRITVLPLFPSGPDKFLALFSSAESGGDPAGILTDIAGDAGLAFRDECGGALDVDGLSVGTRFAQRGCAVGVRVGNFPEVRSPSFRIAENS